MALSRPLLRWRCTLHRDVEEYDDTLSVRRADGGELKLKLTNRIMPQINTCMSPPKLYRIQKRLRRRSRRLPPSNEEFIRSVARFRRKDVASKVMRTLTSRMELISQWCSRQKKKTLTYYETIVLLLRSTYLIQDLVDTHLKPDMALNLSPSTVLSYINV
jgi:hypothetical protein